MNRLLLLICTVFVLSASNSYSQCTPNTAITTPGIFPDSATGLSPAVTGQLYTQVMQLRVPADTVTMIGPLPVTVPIISIELLSFAGLPAGLTYSCNPSNCVYPGGTNGCVAITGTPSVAGHYPITAITKTIANIFGSNVSQFDTIDYYYIDVTTASGLLSEDGLPTFTMSQNMPNPTEDFTNIVYTLPSKSDVEFFMFNMIGKEVYHKLLDGDQGENALKIDVRDFTPGIYMYTMTVGGETISKRMVISKK